MRGVAPSYCEVYPNHHSIETHGFEDLVLKHIIAENTTIVEYDRDHLSRMSDREVLNKTWRDPTARERFFYD